LFFNKELFNQAGIPYPTDDWTWADAMTAAEEIRALDENIFGYFHPLSFFEFYKTVAQNDGALMSEDGREFTFNTPQNLETLNYMIAMQRETNVMPTEAQLGGMGDWDLFKSGRLGMIITGIWAFPDFTRDIDFSWDIVVEPGNTQRATHFFSNAYAVSANSEVAEAAAKFVSFITSDSEAVRIRLDAGWELPPVDSQEVIAAYAQITPPENREAVFRSLNYLVLPPVVTQFSELQNIVNRHLSDAANGMITPEEALELMQRDAEERIDLDR
jgi:multiple sugar transport system substrate-binding protein